MRRLTVTLNTPVTAQQILELRSALDSDQVGNAKIELGEGKFQTKWWDADTHTMFPCIKHYGTMPLANGCSHHPTGTSITFVRSVDSTTDSTGTYSKAHIVDTENIANDLLTVLPGQCIDYGDDVL